MAVEIPVLSGTLNVSPHSSALFNRISKKKQQKHCILFRASRYGIERLEILDKEDDKNPRIITLENCVKITQEPTNQINIFKKTDETITLFALNETDLKKWVKALQSVAFNDRTNELFRCNSVREEENDHYRTPYSDGIFTVDLLADDATELKSTIEKNLHIQPNEPIPTIFTLQLTATEIQLKYLKADGVILVTQWPYRYIRKYGYRNGKFTFEAGRQCETGEHEFKFQHANPQEVFQCIAAKMKSLRKLINGDTIGSVDCDEHHLNTKESVDIIRQSVCMEDACKETTMEDFDPLNSEYKAQLFSAIGKKLYLNSELADVHFVFESNGKSERVPAHKSLLMAGSDVFATMFNGSWKENKKVKIGDASAAVFKEFLQFFYFDQVKLTMENVAAVRNLGEMYKVTECLAVCSKFLKNNLNVDNVFRYYGLATLLNQEDLKTACETFIGFHIKTVFKSTDFLSCDQKTLAQILKLNWMSCTEIELFEACMAWVKAASKQDVLTKELVQTHLGDLFHEFRFGSITYQQFAALIPAYGKTFSLDEQQEIIQMIANPTFQPTIFTANRSERCSFSKIVYIKFPRCISEFPSAEPYKIKSVEKTVFSSNEPILLRRIVWAPLKKYMDNRYCSIEKDVPTTLTISEVSDPNDRVILSETSGVLLKTISFKSLAKPVLIQPGLMYEIRMEQTPPEDYCTGVLLKSEVELESGVVIRFHRDSALESDPKVQRGLISALICQSIS